MIPLEEAIRIVLERSRRRLPGALTLPVEESPGRVLAEDVVAPFDVPAFARSMMDGFALRHSEAAGGRLGVAATISAGELFGRPLGPGSCVRIMTGASLPERADTVVPIEDAEDLGGEMRVLRLPEPGRHVSPRGEDVRAGAIVLRSGQPLGPQEIGILAALGRREVRVFAAPVAAYAVTGDELVVPGGRLSGASIHNSNGYVLRSQVVAAGGIARDLGIVPDREEALTRAIRDGLSSDLLILTGGVSRGLKDFVPSLLRREGVEVLFHGVQVHPGQPTLFGVAGDSLVFGLAGNPWAALLGFELYAAPAIRALQRKPDAEAVSYRGLLAGPIAKKPGVARLTPCVREWRDDCFYLTPVVMHGAADLFSGPGADSVVIVPAESGPLRAGDGVTFRFLRRP